MPLKQKIEIMNLKLKFSNNEHKFPIFRMTIYPDTTNLTIDL